MSADRFLGTHARFNASTRLEQRYSPQAVRLSPIAARANAHFLSLALSFCPRVLHSPSFATQSSPQTCSSHRSISSSKASDLAIACVLLL